MILRWHHGFLDPRDGAAEVGTLAEVVDVVRRVLPLRDIPDDHVSFVRTPKGTQVNLLGFGPFGVLELGTDGD